MVWSPVDFAAGVFLVTLKPFKVGDLIEAGGTTGFVEEIGLFVSKINTLDNVCTFVGNAAIFAGNIRNFTTNAYRRVDLKAQISHDTDVSDAIERLRSALSSVPNGLAEPAPVVEVESFTLAGPVLAVRPFVHSADYWDVYFATNKLITDEFGRAGFAAPSQRHVIENRAA